MFIIELLLALPIIFMSLSLHEAAHAFVANKLGDPTAKNLGRLSLNPMKHIDPIGFLCMLIAGFGWAKPVPITSRNFKKPRRDMALSAIAGPVSNLLLATVFAALMKLFFIFLKNVPLSNSEFTGNVITIVYIFLFSGISMNITLAVFNLIPVPPLDGSRFFYILLPTKYYFGIMRYERYIYLGLMVLLFVGALDPAIDFVSNGLMGVLFKIFAM